MATFGKRAKTLRSLLGMTQQEFARAVGKESRSMVSMWENGTQAADRDTAFAIADRWWVDLDSLYAKPGTVQLEPSPALQNAQRQMLLDFSGQDTLGTERDRLGMIHEGIRSHVPGFSIEAWAEWLRWTPDEWEQCADNHLSPGNLQITGAAFVAGWYHGQDMWSRWIRTGAAEVLRPATEREVTAMCDLLLQRRDALEWRRLLSSP